MTARQSSGTLYAEDCYLWRQQQAALLATPMNGHSGCSRSAMDLLSRSASWCQVISRAWIVRCRCPLQSELWDALLPVAEAEAGLSGV